ncbi:MAG: polyphosphate polymerase domain-containing protein [Butyrivibrio sp.]|nr:polyphosphate polymerase domain-containing protein [Butyrivibrio sp.]
MFYRVEDKYIVYEDQIAYIRHRLKNLMQMDSHSSQGSYLIRSIYFDDMDDSFLEENEAGVDNKTKIRIRNYNGDDSFIRLEEKSKKGGYTHKETAVISRNTVSELIAGASLENAPTASGCLLREDGFLFKKLFCLMNTRLLHPVTIIEYEREAFVEKSGNVRISIDRNIGGSEHVERFFEKDIFAVPVMERGVHLLEVKYDEFLPDYIEKVIDIGSLQRTAFSKFYYARQINERNGVFL